VGDKVRFVRDVKLYFSKSAEVVKSGSTGVVIYTRSFAPDIDIKVDGTGKKVAVLPSDIKKI
jgi:ribosomal protein L21E